MVIIPQSEFSDTIYSPGVLLRLFFFFLLSTFLYIACYLGINLFCISHRWTWRQYTEPCECKWSTSLITAYLSLYVKPSSQFSLSIALFILIQGSMPLFWCAISEVKGRKASHVELVDCLLGLIVQLVYLASLSLCTIGTIVVALSRNIELWAKWPHTL